MSSTKNASGPAPSANGNEPRAVRASAERARARLSLFHPVMKTVDIVGPGKIAVTRPGMPRLFRFLLALTGVRV
jgi:hypothetical protein